MKITQTANIEYPISLLQLQTRFIFKSGIMGFIAYTRFNYNLEDLKFQSVQKLLKVKQYSYTKDVVYRMKADCQNGTTHYFSKLELKELEALFTHEYVNLKEQNKKIISFI